MKSRSNKAFLNGISGLALEFVNIVCGLILPRMILGAFGSSYNGITQSITQFLSFVTLLRAGVGAVTKAALYKPLAYNDANRINRVIRATEIFMQRVSFIFAAGLVGFAVLYPLLVSDEFEWFFAFSLVLIIGVSTFAQYYFGITYQLLLEADQSQYIVSVIQIIATIANVIIAAILINAGAGIHAVKLGSSIIFALNPVALNLVVRRQYKIDRKVEPDNSAMEQRWDAFAQQLAMLVRDNSPIVIVTLVSNTLEVSVYTVYYMVIKAVNGMIRAFTNGIGAAFGNMLARGEETAMQQNLRVYEFLVYSLTAVLFSCVYVLITPFALVYTRGITDVSYDRPMLGYMMVAAYVFYCVRIPYQNMVEVAGHFKQTKKSAYIEAGLNVVISVIACWKLGIIGVAVGMLVAMVYRTFHYALYVSKHLVIRKKSVFFKHLSVFLANMVVIIAVCGVLPMAEATSYLQWGINGVIVFATSVIVTAAFDFVFFKTETKIFMDKIMALLRR